MIRPRPRLFSIYAACGADSSFSLGAATHKSVTFHSRQPNTHQRSITRRANIACVRMRTMSFAVCTAMSLSTSFLGSIFEGLSVLGRHLISFSCAVLVVVPSDSTTVLRNVHDVNNNNNILLRLFPPWPRRLLLNEWHRRWWWW